MKDLSIVFVLYLVHRCSKLGKKVVTSIRLDQDILRTAKEIGLNVSRVSENALKEAIKRLQTPVQHTETKEVQREGRGRDLNPGGRLHRPVG